MKTNDAETRGEVALFVTCLIDLIRPSLGFAAVELLEDAGYSVTVPTAQTCCGQPNYNGGDRKGAIEAARRTIDAFDPCEFVVAASGSCAGMIKHHYPGLCADDRVYYDRAVSLGSRVYELSTFLLEVADYRPPKLDAVSVTYHDACAGLREMGVKAQPRELLNRAGVQITEMSEPEVCCGFGGTFCVKYPNISDAMVGKKVNDAISSGAVDLIAGDLGCILNIEGKLHRDGKNMKARHFAELLASGLKE